MAGLKLLILIPSDTMEYPLQMHMLVMPHVLLQELLSSLVDIQPKSGMNLPQPTLDM